MTDITTISTALTSLKAATDIASFFKNTNMSLEKAEAKMKVAELITALAEVKIQLAEVQQTQIEKESTIRELQRKMELKESLVYEEPYYWLKVGPQKDGPFCQQCNDNDSKLIRLQKTSSDGYWHCPTCKNYFETEAFRSRPNVTYQADSDYD